MATGFCYFLCMANSWTFLSSHGLVYLAVARDPDATLREIGDAVGITERAAHSLVSDLVDEGYLIRIKNGRRNRYELRPDQPLKHELNRARPVEDLLRLLAQT